MDERDPAGRTALHAAAFAGSVYAANALIRAGADMSATTREKKTPLLLAVCICVVDIIIELRYADRIAN